jgi:hypothetical protein
VCIGLFLIYTGFWGFYAACNIDLRRAAGGRRRVLFRHQRIYLQATTLSAITFNFIMALAGGDGGLHRLESRCVLVLRQPRGRHCDLGRPHDLYPIRPSSSQRHRW